MILAAGLGERLRPLTETTPKALVTVGGRPLIEYSIDTLVRSDVREVIINLHHLGDQIRDHLGDGDDFGIRITYSEENPLLGSGGGIAAAREFLDGDDFVTMNADTIIDIDLGPIVDVHQRRQATATMVLRKSPDMAKFGLIGIGPDQKIERFLKTRRTPSAVAKADVEDFMFTGVQILSPRVFDYMPNHGGPFSITEAVYPKLLLADEPLFGSPFDGTWITVGTPEELERADARLLKSSPSD